MSANFVVRNDTSANCAIGIYSLNGASIAGGNVRPNQTNHFDNLFAGTYTVTFGQVINGFWHPENRRWTFNNNATFSVSVSSVMGSHRSFSGETKCETVGMCLNPEDLKVYLAAGGKASDYIDEAFAHASQKIVKITVDPLK